MKNTFHIYLKNDVQLYPKIYPVLSNSKIKILNRNPIIKDSLTIYIQFKGPIKV